MALAGYDVQKSMRMLPNVLSMASAGGMDLARASDMITDASSALGLTEERTTQMVNEFAKAASTGNTSVEQLGDAFLTVGGLAAELNGGFITLADGTQQEVDNVQELEIAFVAMANAGIKGSEAGTHMRNMISKLSSPSKEGAERLAALGVSVFDSAGQMRSLADIMGDLSVALGNVTQEEKINAITELFNARDIASAEALLSAVNQDWNKIGKAVYEAGKNTEEVGAAAEMAKTKEENLQGAMRQFNSALEAAKITVSDQLTPTLTEFVKFGTDGVSKLVTAFGTGGLSGVMGTFGNILADGINKIFEVLPSAINAGVKLISELGKGVISNLPAVMNAVGKAFMTILSAAVSALPSLLGGLTAGINSLIEFLIQQTPELINAVKRILVTLSGALTENIPILLENIGELIFVLIEEIVSNLPSLIRILSQVVKKIVGMLITLLPELLAGLENLIIEVIGYLPEILTSIVDLLPILVDAVVMLTDLLMEQLPDILMNLLPQIVDASLVFMTAFIREFPRIVQILTGAIPEILEILIETIGELTPMLLSLTAEIILEIAKNLPDMVFAIIEAIISIGTSLVELIKSFLPYALRAISSIIKGIVDNFPEMTKNLLKKVNETGDKIIKSFGDFKERAKTLGKAFVQGLWEGIESLVGWIGDRIDDFSEGIWEGFKGFFGIHSPSTLFAWAGGNMALGLGEGFSDEMKDISSSMTKAVPTQFDVETVPRAGMQEKGYSFTINIENVNGLTKDNAFDFGRQLSEQLYNTIYREKVAVI